MSTFRINYLYHSSFSLETDSHLLIFDYYKDSVDQGDKNRCNGAISTEDLTTSKQVIVFSSHSHGDHFNPIILQWRHLNSTIQYVFSSDITPPTDLPNLHCLSPYETCTVCGLEIKAYGSTDLGVSFYVKLEDRGIFHAGDLNWWYWWDDTEEEITKATTWFKKEIDAIKNESIDVAFFPVDQRLEHNYALGAKYFIQHCHPKTFIPMHFGDYFETSKKFTQEMVSSPTQIITLTHRGQEITL